MTIENYLAAATLGLVGGLGVLAAAIRVLWRQHIKDGQLKDEIARTGIEAMNQNTHALEQIREILRGHAGRKG